MRQSHLRTLAARGLSVQKSIGIRGIDAYLSLEKEGSSQLVFSGSWLGPSWINIAHVLDMHEVKFSVFMLGRPYLVAEDSGNLRSILSHMTSAAKRSIRDEVFIEGEGFVVSGMKKGIDVSALIAPAIVLSISVILAANTFFSSPPNQENLPQEDPLSCALDMSDSGFSSWIRQQLVSRDKTPASQLLVQTEIGVINLTVEQTIGSTQLMTGTVGCDDGRSRTLKFRTDTQDGGGFLELEPRLDP